MDLKKTRLFCIPFSGGNAYSYSEFKKYIPDNIELCNLELPGRGKRISEPLLHSVESMTEDLFLQIETKINENYVIFGHSLGSLLGITLCRYISVKGMNLPLILFLSGQTAPASIKPDNKHTLPDDQFINMLREMAGTPEELLTDKSFLQFFLPVVRADFQALSDYNYTSKNTPLDVPITIMLGKDEKISDEDAAIWQLETDNTISVHRFEGGHFFIFDHIEKISNLIAEKIKSQLKT
ncbi:MAG: thioesterase domain-containing protein [Ignavibacteriales bacterium]|nr:thioesterase domain-containing protein [Ignavibacteriales bacterium]